MRVTDLPDALRDAGLDVVAYHDPFGHGRSLATIKALVVHDTVTTRDWSDESVCDLLRNGRPGVPGPLSQLAPDRQGRFHVIADGRANHNGYGQFGNDTLGIETMCAGGMAGREEPWNRAQYDANVTAAAVIAGKYDLPIHRVLGHKETDPSRKIDPYGVDLDRFRRDVRAAIEGGFSRSEEDDMRRGDQGAHVKRAKWRINQALHSGDHDPDGGGLSTATDTFDAEMERYVKHVQSQAGYATSGVLDLATYMYVCELAHLESSHK